MPIRDLAVMLVVFGSIPYIFKRPWIGILVWAWLSYMNPHRLGWGFANNMPVAMITALALLTALLFGKEKKSIPYDRTTILWMIFIAWMGISTIFAIYFHAAWMQYEKILKIQLLTFITMMLIVDQKKLNLLIWVICISIGYFSIKGGLFTLTTGGGFRVWGPPGSFIEENNTLALATLMVVPLFFYLFRIEKRKWIRLGLLAAIVLSVISAMGSQSRGAFLTVIAVGCYFWLTSKYKLVTGIVLVLMAISIFNFMPESWHKRMDTIQHYDTDESATGRLNAWTYAINAANHRFTGAGLDSWKQGTFQMWAPDPTDVHAAHSIYFSILADHGWPGLIMFLMILFFVWLNLRFVVKHSDNDQEVLLAKMLKVTMVAYMSGGAFLSLSYFDLPWHMISFSVLLKFQVLNRQGMPVQKLGPSLQGLTRQSDSADSYPGGASRR